MPDKIYIERYPNQWVAYYKDYDLEDGAYYTSKNYDDMLAGSFVHLHKSGVLTYLWKNEHVWNVKWRL